MNTNDQLALLAAENASLKADLEACGKCIAEQKQRIDALTRAFEWEQQQHDRIIGGMAKRIEEEQSNTRRASSRLYALREHMPTYLTFFLETYAPFRETMITEEHAQLVKTAREFLRLFDTMGD